jgi:formate hydrogenlyase subunit 3/multisubunit Na+/H+ antiporter MnhD subunit
MTPAALTFDSFAFLFLWLLADGWPLLLAALVTVRITRNAALNLAPLAAVPALALALGTQAGVTVEMDWLLLGMRAGLDETSRVFMLFTALLWSLAGIYAHAYTKRDPARHRFFAFFLMAMAGNIGLIGAQDIASFYLFFALMSFSAYPLVVHTGSDEARRAGKVYLVLVVIGEALLMPALLLSQRAIGSLDVRALAAGIAASPDRDLIIGLALAGFGIKAGALPLHVWLPLAHPVAPTPASAVLSGAMIKAGLLGWLRFLPLGAASLPEWSGLCITAGIAAAFYGVAIGLAQDDPKTMLAYSSISQMGLITAGVGIGLAEPEMWPLCRTAVLLYALHHALAKGALFLGVGLAVGAEHGSRERQAILGGMLLPALALAGAPLTSGSLAKLWLKKAAAVAPAFWTGWLEWLLSLAAVGTTLLIARFWLSLQRGGKAHGPHPTGGMWAAWTLLAVCVAFVTLLSTPSDGMAAAMETLSVSVWWPVAAGVAIAWIVWLLSRRWTLHWPQIPSGDLLFLVPWCAGKTRRRLNRVIPAPLEKTPPAALPGLRINRRMRTALVRLEDYAGRWEVAGMLLLFLLISFFVLLAG